MPTKESPTGSQQLKVSSQSEMLLRRAAHNLAESRHLKAVDPSGAQTCPALFPENLLRNKNIYVCVRKDPITRRTKSRQKGQEYQRTSKH